MSLLLDTGADISLIKVGQLGDDDETLRATERVIMGISEEPVTTTGLINLNINMNDKEIVHSFQAK